MPKKPQQPRRKHVPLRTCIACKESKAKRDLVRIVRAADGTVQVDETSKRAGRGAYVCRTRVCWEQVQRKGLLEYALKTRLTDGDREGLKAFYESLPAPGEEAPE